VIALILLALCCAAAPTAAEPPAPAELGATAGAPALVLANLTDVMGARARMIQVACVFVAVGIFLLTRSYR
jgi:hypothetical protein